MNIQRRLVNPNNYSVSRFGANVDLVVLHTMDGFMDGTDSWFNNPAAKVSTHYGVGMSGSVYQWVEESNTAWACGVWEVNKRSISVEFADQNDPQGITRTAEAYQSGAELVADICRRNGIPCNRDHVKGHREVSGSHPGCPGNLDIDHVVQMAQQILGGVIPQPPAEPPADVNYTPLNQPVTVLSGNLNVRSGPATSFAAGQANTPDGMLHNGAIITITGWTHGEDVGGNDVWLRSVWGHWLFSGGTNFDLTQVQSAPVAAPSYTYTDHMTKVQVQGTGIGLNIRTAPSSSANVVRTAGDGDVIDVLGFVSNGEAINGNAKWWKDGSGGYFTEYYAKELTFPATTPAPDPVPAPAETPAADNPTSDVGVPGADLQNPTLDNSDNPPVVPAIDSLSVQPSPQVPDAPSAEPKLNHSQWLALAIAALYGFFKGNWSKIKFVFQGKKNKE